MTTKVAAPAAELGTAQASGPDAPDREPATQPAARPAGPWDTAPLTDVLTILPTLPWLSSNRQQARRSAAGVELLLGWLSRLPGEGWQTRWEHAEAMLGTRWTGWPAAILDPAMRSGHRCVLLTRGLGFLLRMRLVRPSYAFLTTYAPTTTFAAVRDLVTADLFARAAELARERGGHCEAELRKALNVLTVIVIHTGAGLDGVTTGDLLVFQAATAPRRGRSREGCHLAWQMMVDLGFFPPHSTLHAAMRTGPQSTAELVDRHRIADPRIRELLIRYLDERRPALDYSTFRMLVGRLAGAFWADIERHHPGIDTLNLPRKVTDAWKQRLRFPQNGGNRTTPQRHIDTSTP